MIPCLGHDQMRPGYLRTDLAEVNRSIVLAKVAIRLWLLVLLVTSVACAQSAYVAELKILDKKPGQQEFFHQLFVQEPFKRLPDPSAQRDVAETLAWLKARTNSREASARYRYVYSSWLWAAGRGEDAAKQYFLAEFQARWDGTRCAEEDAPLVRSLPYENALGKPIVSFLLLEDQAVRRRVVGELSPDLGERFADNPKDEWLCNGGATYRKYAKKSPKFGQGWDNDPSFLGETTLLPDDTVHPEFISDEAWRIKRIDVLKYRTWVQRLLMVEDEAGKTKVSGVRTVVTLPKPSRALAWSPDGEEIAVVGTDPEVYVVKVKGKNVVRTLMLSRRGGGKGIAYSPDGHYLAAGLGTINVWDVHTGVMKAELVAPFVMDPAVPQDTSVISLGFSPDSHTLATTFRSGGLRKQEIVRYKVETGTRLTVFEPLPTPLALITANVRFSPDGHYLVNTRSINTVRAAEEGTDTHSVIDVWDLRTGGLNTIQGVHMDEITALAMARQGATVAVGSKGWGRTTYTKLSNGTWASIDNHEFIKLWDLRQGVLIKELTTELPGATSPTRDLDFSPDGKYLVSCQGAEILQGDTIWLWEIASGTILQKFKTPLKATYSGVYSCAFSPDGSRIAAVGADELTIIDLKLGK